MVDTTTLINGTKSVLYQNLSAATYYLVISQSYGYEATIAVDTATVIYDHTQLHMPQSTTVHLLYYSCPNADSSTSVVNITNVTSVSFMKSGYDTTTCTDASLCNLKPTSNNYISGVSLPVGLYRIVLTQPSTDYNIWFE